MKRRTVLGIIPLFTVAPALAQQLVLDDEDYRKHPIAEGKEIPTDRDDTFLCLIDTLEHDGSFIVGVRTKVKADKALVTIYYEARIAGIEGKLVLTKSSMAPVVGFGAYGGTHDAFKLPSTVKRIEVDFFNRVVRRKADTI